MAIVVVPRLCWSLMKGATELPIGANVWQETRLGLSMTNETSFKNVLTGELVSRGNDGAMPVLRLAELFASFPMALLYAETGNTERA